MPPAIDDLPGFRRRFIVTPGEGSVTSAVEDDFHCMRVTLGHADGIVTAVVAAVVRAPWSTCPQAEAQLERTFMNVGLDALLARGERQSNCTHLHDLALLAAGHARDDDPLVIDILVSDPVDGQYRAELRRNGETALHWVHVRDRIVEPAELAGVTLFKMRPWIESLDPERQEEARMLRWASLMAQGRILPLEQQSDATRMPPNCYTFQPHIAVKARRIGEIRDFSMGMAAPLQPGEIMTHDTIRRRYP